MLYVGCRVCFVSHAFDENRIMGRKIYKKLLIDKLREVNMGMVTENAVAQMLTAAGHGFIFIQARPKSGTGQNGNFSYFQGRASKQT